MIKKVKNSYLILFALLFIFANDIHSQGFNEEEPENKGRFFISPDFGLQLGTITRIEVAPSFGYYVFERLAAGIGARYEYYQDNFSGAFIPSTHIYGGKVFTRFILIKNIDNIIPLNMYTSIFIHAENEMLSLESKYYKWPTTNEEGRFLLNTVLAGAGFAQPTSTNTAFTIMLLWDLSNNSLRSPYPIPLVRIGFQIML